MNLRNKGIPFNAGKEKLSFDLSVQVHGFYISAVAQVTFFPAFWSLHVELGNIGAAAFAHRIVSER